MSRPSLGAMDDPNARDAMTTAIRAIRRRLLRHRRMVTGLLAAACAMSVVSVLAPSPPDTRSVVVASRDVAAGTILTSHDIRVVDTSASLIPDGASSTLGPFVGRTVAGPIRAGEVVTDIRLVGPALLEGYADDLVATPVPLAGTGLASLLATGDHVDVYAATGDVGASAELIARDAAVVALPGETEHDRDGAIVVVAVSSTEAARLAQAVATTRITVVLRR
jgi:Flp pilus assembly protein CpaB